MLRNVRSRALCQSCRSDIQVLFERGFCIPIVQSRIPRYSSQLPIRSRTSQREFSNGRRAFASNEDGVNKLSERHELQDEEEALASQVMAIEALEKELGKPVKEAMEEDEAAAALTLHDEEPAATPDIDTSDAERFEVLRQGGASQGHVVREARQTFGDFLPDGVLNEGEVKLYKRLYGEPSQDIVEEDLIEEDEEDMEQPIQLYTAEGEEVEYASADGEPFELNESHQEHATDQRKTQDGMLQHNFDPLHLRAQEVALSLNSKVAEDNEYDEVDEEDDSDPAFRTHPLTQLGRFATAPKTTFLSQSGFIEPVEKIMSNFSNKHLKDMCERTFGGPGLPDSPLTPRSGRARKQVPIPLEAGQHLMGEMEANAYMAAVIPPTYASITSVLTETRKRLGSSWLNKLLAREGGPRVLDAGAGGAGILAWRDIVQAHWEVIHSSDREPPSTPASKAVVLTGSDALRHRAADMLENTTFVPRLPDYVHTRDIPTLEDDRPAQQRKQFDVIIAPHTLFGLKEEWMRKQQVQNLWSLLNPEGGVLILIEKGVPRGFEAISGARELLLEKHLAVPDGHKTRYSNVPDDPIHKKGTGMIVAPCTNHERCPMYSTAGHSHGRKDICSFQQRYIRPGFLQKVLGAKDRNHDDVDFSYLSVMKGDDLRLRRMTTWEHIDDPISAPFGESPVNATNRRGWVESTGVGFESYTPETASEVIEETGANLPAPHNLPRSVFPPLKRRGHVTLDLCTPAGKIERWTIPRSFSRQAYRDARKSRWGDLWALGAKTRVPRNLRLGTSEKEMASKDRRGEEIGKGRGRKERLKIKAREILEAREQEKLDEIAEQKEFMRELEAEFATTPNESEEDFILDENLQRKRSQRPVDPNKGKSKSRIRTDIEINTPPHLKTRQSTPPRSASNGSSMDDDTVTDILSDWEAEFQEERLQGNPNKNKGRKAVDRRFGKTTKEARRVQKEINRERELREKGGADEVD